MGPTWAVVVAAGEGRRYGGLKQFSPLGGRPVVDWSVAAARAVADDVVLVLPAAHVEDVRRHAGCTHVVAGGPSRAASVRAGLEAVPAAAEIVVVHDAARPLASPDLFALVVGAVRAGAAGAVPGIPVTDTLKRVADNRVVGTVDRAELVAVQTPQAFRHEALRRAHAAAGEATDDAALLEALGEEVVVVPGDARNVKLTDPVDLERLEAWAAEIGGVLSSPGTALEP